MFLCKFHFLSMGPHLSGNANSKCAVYEVPLLFKCNFCSQFMELNKSHGLILFQGSCKSSLPVYSGGREESSVSID